MSSSTPIFTAPSWVDAAPGASSRTAPSAKITVLRQRIAGPPVGLEELTEPHEDQESGQGPGVSSRAQWSIMRAHGSVLDAARRLRRGDGERHRRPRLSDARHAAPEPGRRREDGGGAADPAEHRDGRYPVRAARRADGDDPPAGAAADRRR